MVEFLHTPLHALTCMIRGAIDNICHRCYFCPDMNKTTSTLIILISVILLGAGIVWYVQMRPKPIIEYVPPVEPSIPPSPVPIPIPEPPATSTPGTPQTPIDVSNWHTYTNTKYGFQIKVPADVTITQGTESFLPQWISFGPSRPIDGAVFWIRINDIDTFIDTPINKNIYEKLLALNKDFERYIPEEVHASSPYTFLEQKLKITGIPALDVLAYGDAGRAVYVLAHNKIFTIFHYKTYINPQTRPPKKISGIGPEFEEILRTFRFLK